MNKEELQIQLNELYTEKQNLEAQLCSNDYKNVKNGEAERAGKPLPYNPLVLYEENQAKRDRINEIEEEIKTLTLTLTKTEEERDNVNVNVDDNDNEKVDENPSDESKDTTDENKNQD